MTPYNPTRTSELIAIWDENPTVATQAFIFAMRNQLFAAAALIERLDKVRDALERCKDYFDQRADAEYETDRAAPIVNEEMSLLCEVHDAIALLPKREK